MCIYSHVTIKHVICFLNQALTLSFFRACFCLVFYSQYNTALTTFIPLLMQTVVSQRYSLCIPSSLAWKWEICTDSPENSAESATCRATGQKQQQTLGCHWMSMTTYSGFIFCLMSFLRQWQVLPTDFSSAPLCLKEGWTTKTTADKLVQLVLNTLQ